MTRCLDLTGNVAVSTALLADPLAWRIRVVEQIDVDSPSSALRRRSLQCAPLRHVIAAAGGLPALRADSVEPESALLVLPVAPIPKGPLLEFDIHGPEGADAFLLQRADIAALETSFVMHQATDAGLAVDPAVAHLLEAALAFSEAQWQAMRPNLRRYLAEGTGLSRGDQQVTRWIDLAHEAGRRLGVYADVPDPLHSAIETPALVVPALLTAGHARSPADATVIVEAYVRLLSEAAALTSSADGQVAVASRTFLDTLVEYGSHYDLMAVVRVPLDEPFLVKVVDRRELTLSRVRNRGEQSVVLADARSNHIALRAVDPNARLIHVRARSATTPKAAYGTFTYRSTPQVHSSYSFEPDRDYRVRLTFRVGLLHRLQLVPYAVGTVLFVVAWLIRDADPSPRELALLIGPGALAASIVLAREPSALGSRLRRLSNLWVVAAMAAVFVVAGWRYVQQ